MTVPVESPRIIFEDETILAIDKPAGMHVFASSAGRQESVCRWLLALRPDLKDVGDAVAPAIVHRMDLYTSGALLAAKNNRAYKNLRRSFSDKEISKNYIALVEGELSQAITLDKPIGARYRRSKIVTVADNSRRLRGVRPAETRVEPLATSAGLTLCRVTIRTGMRHQIRAHLAYLGHPVVGDNDYGARIAIDELGRRFFLHAWSLGLKHPESCESLKLTSPLPDELLQILETMSLSDSYQKHFAPF
jgi:23S rRNA pseudouridine1911/1915/1917 synthase